MRIEIRKVCVNDAMAICQISSNDLGYPCTPELVEAKLKKLDHGREEVFVAVARDKVVGYLHVEKYDVLYAGTMANILGLAVELDHRNLKAYPHNDTLPPTRPHLLQQGHTS